VAGITISPQPVNGTAIVNADFTISYTPDAGFSGTETFGYQVCDQDGDCASATITVTVLAENVENHLPIATDDQATTYLNTPVTIDVLANDTGLEDGLGELTIPASPASGSVQVNANNTITFTPGYFFVGDISFSYLLSDADGDWDMALVTITVTEDENIIPVAIDDEASVEENSSVNIDVLTNDTGLDDTPITVNISQQPTNGTVVVEGDNTVTYTPDSEFFGNDSFNYTVTDANGDADEASVSMTITQAASGIPVAIDDEASTTENTAVSIAVLSNDTELDDAPVVVTISTNPTSGSVVVESDNTVTYTPNDEYSGSDSFSYTVTDANGDADQADVAVTVTEDTNIVPVATDDEASTTENTAVSINVLSNDTGLDDAPVVVTISTNPTSGSVVVESDNTVTYTPNDAFSGSDSFSYIVTDANGDADEADVAVTVTEDTNIVPVATDDEASTTENKAVSINVLSNDTGLDDAPVVVTISTNPTSGSVVVESDNTITYTPNDEYSGSDSFSYTVTDANGDADQADVAVTVTEDTNIVPIANDDYAETNINVAVNIAVLNNDQGLDDSPVILSVSQIAEGGSAIVENDNTITFTPETNFIGQVTFRYAIVDSNGDQDMATVTIDILPGITAINDTIVIEMNETVNISPLKNDLDINGQVQFSILKHPENGTAGFKGAGILTYDPQFNFVGNDSISYQVCSEDNSNDCSSAWIIIQIEEPEFVPTTTFRIPEGFSPDGDGINDNFEIEGLEDYDRVTIHVFNRFGNIIYENDNYQNNWDGTTRKSLGGSGSLPTGTYFYVIKVVDTGKQYKGNVFLKK
jgi:gliding motility-associated-like protein